MSWIVHADAGLVVVNKPAGLLSVPGRGADKQDCAWSRVQATYADAQVVHRLDMATSGLLLFGRGAEHQRSLSIAFAERQVDKRYQALVTGEPADDTGEIELPLAADWPHRPRQMVDLARGKPSLTRWRVLTRGEPGHTRIEFEPMTGRSHQLRVHAAAMGWPIVGDALYGGAAAARLMLHACHLSLRHPLGGHLATWQSATPF